jgi:DNA-directed RNA polymerase specialized sigma24 family protein
MDNNPFDPGYMKKLLAQVTALARAICGSRSNTFCDADDAAQEALQNVFRKIDQEPESRAAFKDEAYVKFFCGSAIRWYRVKCAREAARRNAAAATVAVDEEISDPPPGLTDDEAIAIVWSVYRRADAIGRRLIEQVLNLPSTREGLADAINVQPRTLSKWMVDGLPPLRQAIENALQGRYGDEATQVLGEAVEHVIGLLGDQEWLSDGANAQSRDVMVALKRFRIRAGAIAYHEVKNMLDADAQRVISLIEEKKKGQQIIDDLAATSPAVAAHANEAAQRAAKIAFIKAISTIRQAIDSPAQLSRPR